MSRGTVLDIWRKPNFEKVRAEVREEIDHACPKSSQNSQRLSFIIRRVIEVGNEKSPDAMVRQYIYCMFALVEHAKNGGLKPPDRNQLLKLAKHILTVSKIPTDYSRHAYLYGDLYLVRSQILRTEGRHVESLWEEQIASYLSQKAPDERSAFQKMSVAIHLTRMGYACLAWDELKSLKVGDLPPNSQWRYCHESHLALRMSYQLGLAKEFYQEHNAVLVQAGGSKLEEWEWERLLRESQESGDIDVLLGLVSSSRKFNKVPYNIETYFLARVVQKKHWMERFRSLPKRSELGDKAEQSEVLWKTAQVLKGAYSPKDDYVFRLESFGKSMSEIHLLRSVYQQLLVRAALVRWLVRRPTFVFQRVAICDYQSLCNRLSNGRTHDVLNLLPDVPKMMEGEGEEIQRAA